MKPAGGCAPQPSDRSLHGRRVRARIYPRIDPQLANRLARHATASGVTETAIVEAALAQYLDRTSDTALVLGRLDRNGRAYARLERDLAFLSEAFAIFVKIWFAHTPTIPEDERQVARTTGEARYRKWLEHVVEQFSGGHRFVDDLPRERVGDETELTKAGTGTTEAR